MRRPLLALITLALLVSTGLLHERIDIVVAAGLNRLHGSYSIGDRLAQFGAQAEQRLRPHYRAMGVDFPGCRVALLAFKDARRIELHARDDSGVWRYVRWYPVLAASGRLGPKLREGDRQVPEGQYRVTFLNANSLYHVSLRLDYPNAFDRAMAHADGRDRLGGDIMIHGKAVSIGCLAVGDEAAEELFTLAARIGMSNIDVLIAPTDFRRRDRPELPQAPAWLPRLYAELAEALAAYPSQR